MRIAQRIGLIAVIVAATQFHSVRAAPIVPGSTTFPGIAIQDVELLPGTPFNPTGQSIFIDDLAGIGGFTITRNAQVGNTITFTGASSLFLGSHPLLGDFELGAGPPINVGSFHGVISNMTQDPADPGFASGNPSSFLSGDLHLDVPMYAFRFVPSGVTVYTKDNFFFTSVLDGLPPSPGTILQGDGTSLDVFFNIPNTNIELLVGYSTDRRIEITAAVPEPSSLALCGMAVAGLFGYARRRRATA